jgi:hypothetical protein
LVAQLAASDGSLFDLRRDTVSDIVGTIVTHVTDHKARSIAEAILKALKAKTVPAG